MDLPELLARPWNSKEIFEKRVLKDAPGNTATRKDGRGEVMLSTVLPRINNVRPSERAHLRRGF